MAEIRASLEQEKHTSVRQLVAPGLRVALMVGVGDIYVRQRRCDL
jgi:hypothetical protein